MTSRRSINQWDARLSRAMQFVPGHVSGRVNSAQPVVRRRGIGMMGAPTPPPPPDFQAKASMLAPTYRPGPPDPVYVTLAGDIGDMPEGEAIVAFVAYYDASGVTMPSGWHVMSSGSVGGSIDYALAWASDNDVGLEHEIGIDTWGASAFLVTMYQVFEWPTGAFPYELRATVDVTTGEVSAPFASPDPSWSGGYSATIAVRESGTGSPSYSSDMTVDGTANIGPINPKVSILYPIDGSGWPIDGTGGEVGVQTSALGSFASFALGWAVP